LKLTDRIGFVNHQILTKKLLKRLHIRDVVDLGAGLNPQHEIRKQLKIRQLLIDLGYPEEEEGPNLSRKRIDVMNFESIRLAVQEFDRNGKNVDGKIDAVISIQNIEHLEKQDGEQLLEFLELIARKLIVIETPNGFVSQPGTINNPFQAHKSGWTVKDFTSRGFEVRGTSGLKFLKKNSDKGEYRLNIRGMRLFDVLISRVFLIHLFPRICFNIFAYRKL
jgi:hypothetical protein